MSLGSDSMTSKGFSSKFSGSVFVIHSLSEYSFTTAFQSVPILLFSLGIIYCNSKEERLFEQPE